MPINLSEANNVIRRCRDMYKFHASQFTLKVLTFHLLSPGMAWQITSPCLTCTSCIHAGRMLRIVGNDSSAIFTLSSSAYRSKIHQHRSHRETAAAHDHTACPNLPLFLSRSHRCCFQHYEQENFLSVPGSHL